MLADEYVLIVPVRYSAAVRAERIKPFDRKYFQALTLLSNSSAEGTLNISTAVLMLPANLSQNHSI